MKRLATSALLLALLSVQSIGHAATTFTGMIQIGNPTRTGNPVDGSTVSKGYTEQNAACDPASSDNGVDGVWLNVSALTGQSAVLTLPSPASDVDVYFWDAACAPITYSDMAKNFVALGRAPFKENTETGTIPATAAFALVHGFAGANIEFTLTVG